MFLIEKLTYIWSKRLYKPRHQRIYGVKVNIYGVNKLYSLDIPEHIFQHQVIYRQTNGSLDIR